MGEAIEDQIVRLIDAIDNQFDPLWLTGEPLLVGAKVRYGELRHKGFEYARHAMRAEAIASLIARGGNLPPAPVVLDDDP